MARDGVPAPVQPLGPAPVTLRPSVGAGLTAAMGQGPARGAAPLPHGPTGGASAVRRE